MNPLRIQGANVRLVGDGKDVKDLHVIKSVCPTHGTSFTSAWEPTPDELARLNAGEPVLLTVHSSSFAPVRLAVRDA